MIKLNESNSNRGSMVSAAVAASTLNITIEGAGSSISAEIFLPDERNDTMPPLVAIHGISRDAKAIADAFAGEAASTGRVLVVPHFAKKSWKAFQRIEKARPDIALLGVLKTIHDAGLPTEGRISLFGYSGGAQLAHRFAMLYPQRVQSLHIAAPGWYCLPDDTVPAPYGLGNSGRAEKTVPDFYALSRQQLDVFLRLPVKVYVGEGDTEADSALRDNDIVNAIQGSNRRARAENYVKSFAEAAQSRGIEPSISLQIIPDCAHDFIACAASGELAKSVLA